jgi:hypothetical protein
MFCAYALAWKLRVAARPAGQEGELSSASSHGAPAEVGGFAGAHDLEDGGRLSARLLPLQAIDAWESFDAGVLAQRLGLPDGEPWRLELRYEAGPAPGRALPLAGLVVVDAGGGALAPPPGEPGAPPSGAPADPLRVLFLHPTAELPPGTEVQLFLWGRAPGAEPRLLLGAHPDLALDLAPVRVPSGEVLRHIARVDGPAPEAGDAR